MVALCGQNDWFLCKARFQDLTHVETPGVKLPILQFYARYTSEKGWLAEEKCTPLRILVYWQERIKVYMYFFNTVGNPIGVSPDHIH